MVIYDHDKFKSISQLFFLLAMLVYFIMAYVLKSKKIEITYKIALRLFFIIFPIIAFPFIFLSTMSPTDKFISTLIAMSGCLFQFYGTMAFHKIIKKTTTSPNKV